VIKGSDVLNTKGVEELLRRVGLGRGNARWGSQDEHRECPFFTGENGENR